MNKQVPFDDKSTVKIPCNSSRTGTFLCSPHKGAVATQGICWGSGMWGKGLNTCSFPLWKLAYGPCRRLSAPACNACEGEKNLSSVHQRLLCHQIHAQVLHGCTAVFPLRMFAGRLKEHVWPVVKCTHQTIFLQPLFVLFMFSMLSILHLCLELHLMIDSVEVISGEILQHFISKFSQDYNYCNKRKEQHADIGKLTY